MKNPFPTQRVQLSRETIDFAIWEGTELYNNRVRVRPSDTLETKITNSLLGAFGQQVMVNELGARRVTKEECPDFAYDVVVNHDELLEWTGYRNRKQDVQTRDARIEIKDLGMATRKFISFYDGNVNHARKCAKNERYDYMVCFGVNNFSRREYTADVNLIGILTAATVSTESRLWRDSNFKADMKYLVASEVNTANAGLVFL